MDIVVQLRQGDALLQSAADTIEFLRVDIERLKRDRIDAHRISMDAIRVLEDEVDRLGESLNKCHEQMMRRTDGPVHGDELVSELLADGRYKVRFR